METPVSETRAMPKGAMRLEDWVAKAKRDLIVDEHTYGVAHQREGGGTGLNPEYVAWLDAR